MLHSSLQTLVAGVMTLAVAWLCAGCASVPPREHAANASSATRSVFSGNKGELVAIVFISSECPIANAMMPDIKAIASDARARGVRFVAVHPTSWTTEQSVVEHARTFGIDGAFGVVLDARQEIAAAVGATVTPEGALLRLDGTGGFERLYLGRVNDLYAAIGRRRATPTSNDLAIAIRAAHEGRATPSPAPRALGCFIEYSSSSPSSSSPQPR
ncbi:MAG: hypothetical protein RLZZ116_982 [Planctomycetota bacterium]|jgi:thiol-disulfide isomerase/thioredoxin